MHRRVAVGLQVLDRLLARLQRVDLGAQRRDVLDLRLEPLDLGLQEVVAGDLRIDPLLQRHVPQADDDGADHGRDPECDEEGPLARGSGRLAVRQ